MAKITTHLWFDKEAKEAAAFYTSTFDDSETRSSSVIHDTPSGDCDIVTIAVMGHEIQMISAGPLFKFNPSISLMVSLDSAEKVDALWEKLIAGGSAMMPLDKYPFSERYGWLKDKFGMTWQIMYGPDAKEGVIPTLMFVGDRCGHAEDALNHYTSIFQDTAIDHIQHWEKGEPGKEGTVKHAGFSLEGQRLAVMDAPGSHDFDFNEAVSLKVNCKDQAEIDAIWDRLTADPKSEQCGWLKDKFGVSWQIAPAALDEMMNGDPEAVARVTKAFLEMKKFDVARLEQVYRGA